MRSPCPALVLVLLLGCSAPLSLDGGRFGPLGFFPGGAIATEGSAGLTVLALEVPLSCEEMPPAQPGQKSLVLQVFEPSGPGTYPVTSAGAAFARPDACALTAGAVEASAGEIELTELGADTLAGRFDLVVEGESVSGAFSVPLCERFPVEEPDCPDDSDLPPPGDPPEGF